MNIKNYIKSTLFVLTLISFSSCDKFLDVEPKTQLREGDLFKTQKGYQEALNGVYLQMSTTQLYGRNLTYGFADVLGGMYVESKMVPTYVPVFRNEYTNATVQVFIDDIWLSAYKAIANLNNLISQLEVADRTIFTGDTYNVVKGEAYGLRAMLYFDLYRLFGKTKVNGGDDLQSIPYRTTYNAKVVGKSSGKEVMAGILEDLVIAEQALKIDPLITVNPGLAAGIDRKLRMNYYAVKGLMARYYLWNADTEKALAAAVEVINSTKFPFTSLPALTAADPDKDRTFIPEQLFAVYSTTIKADYAGLLVVPTTVGNGFGLEPDLARLNLQYETATVGNSDRRLNNLTLVIPTVSAGPLYFFTKLFQPEESALKFNRRLPLMKIPEMYYIAAECLKSTEPLKAIEYLNMVRVNRSIAALGNSLTADQIQDEIRKEYWKEMPLEGQMFFYYKRTNSTAIPGKTGVFDPALYTLPLPLKEVELGF